MTTLQTRLPKVKRQILSNLSKVGGYNLTHLATWCTSLTWIGGAV